MQYLKLRVVNTISYAVMIVINVCANIVPIGNGTTAEVSAKYNNLFTPAGYTFSIWLVIYVLMGVFVLYQWSLLSRDEKQITKDINRNSLLFSLTCLINSLWIFVWHYDMIMLSVVLIVLLLVTLITIQGRFTIKCGDDNGRKFSLIGFDIYTGWIAAASIANVSAWLVSIGWNGFNVSSEIWMIILVLIGTVIGSLFSIVSGKYFSTIAMVWAYIGILVNISPIKNLSIFIPATICVCIVIMMVVAIKGIVSCYSKHKASEPVI